MESTSVAPELVVLCDPEVEGVVFNVTVLGGSVVLLTVTVFVGVILPGAELLTGAVGEGWEVV